MDRPSFLQELIAASTNTLAQNRNILRKKSNTKNIVGILFDVYSATAFVTVKKV